MPLSSSQFSVVRSWVGALPTDDDLDERYDRWFTALNDDTQAMDSTILEVMRAALAAYVLDQPQRISLPSGLSVDFSAGITALQAMIKIFSEGGSSKGIHLTNVTRLSRAAYR